MINEKYTIVSMNKLRAREQWNDAYFWCEKNLDRKWLCKVHEVYFAFLYPEDATAFKLRFGL